MSFLTIKKTLERYFLDGVNGFLSQVTDIQCDVIFPWSGQKVKSDVWIEFQLPEWMSDDRFIGERPVETGFINILIRSKSETGTQHLYRMTDVIDGIFKRKRASPCIIFWDHKIRDIGHHEGIYTIQYFCYFESFAFENQSQSATSSVPPVAP